METKIAEIPVDDRHVAVLLKSPVGVRVGLFYTSTNREFASISMDDVSRESMARVLSIIDEFAPKPPRNRPTHATRST